MSPLATHLRSALRAGWALPLLLPATAGATEATEEHPVVLETGDLHMPVLGALERNETFRTAALPKTIQRPILSKYETGMFYGTHIDNPIQRSPEVMRLDMSITIFLNDPGSYGGGELVLDTGYGEKAVKLPAGDAMLYPTTMLHRVAEVTSGERLAAITWIQSMVRDQAQRQVLRVRAFKCVRRVRQFFLILHAGRIGHAVDALRADLADTAPGRRQRFQQLAVAIALPIVIGFHRRQWLFDAGEIGE